MKYEYSESRINKKLHDFYIFCHIIIFILFVSKISKCFSIKKMQNNIQYSDKIKKGIAKLNSNKNNSLLKA